jgi:hypothetical protein
MAQSLDAAPASFTETAGNLTAAAVTVAANVNRRGLIIGNPSDTVMTFRIGGTASATAGVPIPAGNAVRLDAGSGVPSAAVSVFCAGSAKAYCIYEW